MHTTVMRACRCLSQLTGLALREKASSGVPEGTLNVPVRTGDHVLDVVRMPRAVHVRVVAPRRLVLHARRADGDAARALLRGLVNRVKRDRAATAVLCQHLIRDCEYSGCCLGVERLCKQQSFAANAICQVCPCSSPALTISA